MAAMQPQQKLPLPHNPTGIAVLAVSSVGVFVDIIVVGLRLWSRRLKRKPLGLGDYLIIFAWILAFADLIRKIVAFKWGVGLHMIQILSTDPSHLLDAARITFAGYFVWVFCCTCIKMSILLAYTDFFYCLVWFMRCVKVTMVLCILYCIGFTIGLCLQCTPFEMNYNPSVPGGKCGISRKGGFYVVGAVNLFIDVILVVLPLPVVWTLNISKIKKIGVSMMFGLGTIIIILVGYRFHMIRHQNTADFIHDGEPPGIFTSLELYLGIISACAPFLSPPIAKMGSRISESRLLSYLTSQSASPSREKIDDIDSNKESLEVGGDGGSKRSMRKDPYNVSTFAEESRPGSAVFVTVPSHWPSEVPSKTV